MVANQIENDLYSMMKKACILIIRSSKRWNGVIRFSRLSTRFFDELIAFTSQPRQRQTYFSIHWCIISLLDYIAFTLSVFRIAYIYIYIQ